jgi:hypothetical protein
MIIEKVQGKELNKEWGRQKNWIEIYDFVVVSMCE